MKKFYVIIVIASVIAAFTMCHKAEVFPDTDYDPRLSAGAATVFDASSKAFTNAIEGLSARNLFIHNTGDNTFDATFVEPPSPIFTGLGPIYNNIACVNCHRNDGEGIPTAGFSNSGLLFRISIPGVDAHGGPLAAPGFGGQLQDQAVIGAQPEANINIAYTDVPVTYPDGTVTILHQPVYTVQNPYLPLPPVYFISPRLAPPLVGLGLLENVPQSTILSFQDPIDANHDGIRGKANFVYDVYTQQTEIGRFGWKANTPTLLTQVATAYQQDMGVTSYVQPVESAFGQTQMNVVHGDVSPELVDSLLNYVTYYVKTLAVPARRNVTDPDVQRGQQLFSQINCVGCHRPTMNTGVDETLSQISNQQIHPYTDLLLHDMGPGLADNRNDYLALGGDWRTASLWGIGLLTTTNGTPYYLHDGRAQTLEEAILWHDGEAAPAKQAFMQLSSTDRANLIKFLNSL